MSEVKVEPGEREAPPLLASTWAELKRRKVVRAAIAYAIAAWVAMQVAEVTFQPLGLPQWAMTWTVLGAILGFPVVLVLAWYFEAGPGGIARETPLRGRAGSGRLFAVVVVLSTVLGVGWWLAQVYAPARYRPASGSAPPNSIAVLPFDDLSEGHDQGWLADGIAEELLDRLARVEGLRVAARTSSFAFRGRAQDVKEIGQTLNTAYVLEGSVRKAGGRVRVTAQLINAADGFHLWSETYERSDKDIFALQDQVTDAIAAELKQRVQGVGEVAAAAQSKVDPHAHELYLEGRQQWRLRTPASLARAQQLFEQALKIDDKLARAWAGLADTYLLQIGYGSLPFDEAVQKAEPAVVRAITLEPRLGEAWASLGLLRMNAGQHEAAQRSLLEAIRLDPRYEMAPMWLAAVYGLQGDFAKQRETLLKAAELNPLEPVINVNLAESYAARGEFDTARAVLERLLAVLPNNDLLLRTSAGVEAQAGRLDRAVRDARRAFALEPKAPANMQTLFETLLGIEDLAAAEQVVAGMPPGTRQLAMARQTLELHRGETRIVDELGLRLAPLMGGQREPSPEQRDELSLAGTARLIGGDNAQASALLARAVGEPDDLEREFKRLDPASLLVIALRAEKRSAEAAPWETAIRAVGARALEGAGNNAQTEYIRGLFAAFEGKRAETLAALERAYTAGFRSRWQLLNDPRLALVRDTPEVKALAKRIGDDLARMRAPAGAAKP